MIWILTKILSLLRFKNSSYGFQQWICPCAVRSQLVSLFYLPSIHQISTLEKTNFQQRSILNDLMSVRTQRISLFLDAAHSTNSKVIDFRIWFSQSFPMQWKVAHQNPFTASRNQIHHRLRFCCDSFFTWIFFVFFSTSLQSIGRTEMANGKQTQKMIPFITCEISLAQYVCELVFGVNVFDLEIESNGQSRTTLWVLETCFFPLWSFWSLLRCLQTQTKKLPDEMIGR